MRNILTKLSQARSLSRVLIKGGSKALPIIVMLTSSLLLAACGGSSGSSSDPAESSSSLSSSTPISSSSESSSSSLSSSSVSSSLSSQSSESSSESSSPSVALESGIYHLYNAANGFLMDLADESTENGGNVITWDPTDGLNQQIEIARLDTGYYVMMPYHSGKALEVWSESMNDDAELRQYSYSGRQHQQWQIEPLSNGEYRIIARHSGKALSPASADRGAKVVQRTVNNQSLQRWHIEPVAGLKQYNLVWSDEFDYQGLPNDAYWGYERGMVRNNEAQYYTVARPENVNVANGVLTITARRESFDEANYTSASLRTSGKVSWVYGRFEMRARLDTRDGLWPAFWALGPGKWPEGGEIDMMEFYQNKILSNVAWKDGSSDAWSASWDSSTRALSVLRAEDPNWSNKFHTWRMDWTRDSIRLYVDDILMNSTNLNNTRNPDGSNPFRDKSFYILINLAIGGNNGGNPANTSFPATYEIDYVRVYQ